MYTPLGSARGITKLSVGCQCQSVRPVSVWWVHGGWATIGNVSLVSTSRPPVPPYQPIR